MDLDAYERLCAAPQPAGGVATDASAQREPAAPEPRTQEPIVTGSSANRQGEKTPQPSSAVEIPNIPGNKAKTGGLEDLTQAELLDKINRDIDAWKTAQDAKRTEELQSAVRDLPSFEMATGQLEEEERFFLEPIE